MNSKYGSKAIAIATIIALSLHCQSSLAQQEQEKRATAKAANETWEAYVNRLTSAGYLTDEQKRSWNDGEEIQITKAFTRQMYRSDRRTRTVPTTRYRKEVRDGETYDVPYTENVTESYLVVIPYSATETAEIQLPEKGSQPDDVEFPGFVDRTGESVVTSDMERPEVAKSLEASQDPVKDSRKRSDETWAAYVNRLVEEKFLRPEERDHWLKGNPLIVGKQFSRIVTRTEARTRVVSVARMQKKKTSDGNEIEVPVVTQVPQQYTVEVPYMEMHEMVIDLPAPETMENEVEYDGFLSPLEMDSTLPLDEQLADMTQRTSKQLNESWEEYIARLREGRIINSIQVAKWRAGNQNHPNVFDFAHPKRRSNEHGTRRSLWDSRKRKP